MEPKTVRECHILFEEKFNEYEKIKAKDPKDPHLDVLEKECELLLKNAKEIVSEKYKKPQPKNLDEALGMINEKTSIVRRILCEEPDLIDNLLNEAERLLNEANTLFEERFED